MTQVQNIQLSPDNNLISILDDRYVLKPNIHSADIEEPMFHTENLEISSEGDLILINSMIIVAARLGDPENQFCVECRGSYGFQLGKRANSFNEQ